MALKKELLNKIINHELLVNDISDDDLAEFCIEANSAYRLGKPIISDQDYDFVYLEALKERIPNHYFFQSIEPEVFGFSEEKVLLPEVMLSTDKAYTLEELKKWLERVERHSLEIDLEIRDIEIKATPKLDGFAGYDDGSSLYTRGDGKKGSNISRVFDRGLSVYNESSRGQGPGEIVVKKSYFEKYLTDTFEYPRNFQASLIKEKELDEKAKKAIETKAALFVPFSQLPTWKGSIEELKGNFESIFDEISNSVDFDVDGVVFEALNEPLKQYMGSNRKFHRWQIAFKENKDKAQVKVISITSQVGRTGKITPVAELEPTILSGARIVRATGHHYGLVKEQGLGEGSIVELVRSGLVIPKINKVLKSVQTIIPNKCPSCNEDLSWDSDFLLCINHKDCPAQVIGRMEYFFKILANNDGFGFATIDKLYDNGISKVSQIYKLTISDLIEIGFGEKTSSNLINQLSRSRTEQVEDWRYLSAFGIARMGLGNCENLLKSHPLEEIFQLTSEQISSIDGFAELTAKVITEGLHSIREEFELLSKYEFNLERTVLTIDNKQLDHSMLNKRVVFSGKMKGSRSDMKKYASSIGIQVSSSVSSKTDFLVTGENVGKNKIASAELFGVKVISEKEYLKYLGK
jgi:DNA ligase (NAD+)